MKIEINRTLKAGNVVIFNNDEQLLEVDSYQPFDYALHKARQLGILLKCDVFINGVPDDNRKVQVDSILINEVERI